MELRVPLSKPQVVCIVKLNFLMASIVSLFFVQPALAWNDFGHMAVACVCYEHLTPEAKKRANELIKLNPLYNDYVLRVSQSKQDKDEQIFMLAATWPDTMWHNPEYSDDAPGSKECAENIGYSDKHRHKAWHNADFPFSSDNTPVPPLPEPNAETQIPRFAKVLSSNDSDDLKSYDLCWLMHIVGDVHQPLHCCSRVTHTAPNGDGGGFFVMLNGKDTRLHLLWDAALGTDEDPESAIFFAQSLKKSDPKLVADLDASDWIKDGHKIAIEKVYQRPIGPGEGPYTVTPAYIHMASDIAKPRAELAGERLAKLLNENLK